MVHVELIYDRIVQMSLKPERNCYGPLPELIEREEARVVLILNECGIDSRPQLLASLHDLSGVLKVTDDLDNS